MNNFKQPGDVITLTAPAGGVSVGLGYKIGQLFVVAAEDAAVGALFPAQVTGVLELVKDAGTAWAEGDLLYWDDVADNVTTAATGNMLIGSAISAVGSAAVLGDVRLNSSPHSDHVGDAGSNVIEGDDLGAPDLADPNYFLISTVMLATAYTLDQTTLPADNPPRNIIVTHTTDTTTDTLGDMVIDGTNVDDEVIQETLTIAADGTVIGTKAFKTVTACTSASWVQGGGVSDTIEIGFDTLLGLSEIHALAGEVFLAFLAGVARLPDAVAVDAVNVEENTISLSGGTYDSTKTAKVLIKL